MARKHEERVVAIIAAVVVGLFVIAACLGFLSSSDIGASAPENGPAIAVTGTCSDSGGMRMRSSGFTPNGSYTTEAWYPNGSPYLFIVNGAADASGATPHWRWDCSFTETGRPDPEGTYRIRMTDVATGRSATTEFVVSY